MKRWVLIAVLAGCGTAPGLAGTYNGHIQQTAATVTLEQDGTALSGKIDAAGYGYSLTGTADGLTAEGTLKDDHTGAEMRFEARLDGDSLTITLIVDDRRTPLAFTRGGRRTEAPAAAERDPTLVGRWRHTFAQAGGGASVAVDTWLVLNADGSYRYGDSKAAGGDGSIGISVGGGDDVAVGEWKNGDRILHYRESGSSTWQPFARYYVEGDKLLLTFSDGSRKIWYRR